MKRIISYTLSIVILFVLQSTLFRYFALADMVPNLLVIFTASVAIIRGKEEGMAVGFFWRNDDGFVFLAVFLGFT